MRKKYYRITFVNNSAISVGSGLGVYSDQDIILDSRGYAFIPASALAGVYRNNFKKTYQDSFFGMVEINKDARSDKSKALSSNVLVYDANLCKDEFKRNESISIRDNVALDEYRTAKDGAKFDYEVLGSGKHFVTYIEVNEKDEQCLAGDAIVYLWQKGYICVGAKTSRGLGVLSPISIDKAEFDLSNEATRNEWLDFDMYNDAGWNECSVISKDEVAEYLSIDKAYNIELELKLVSPITVRVYSTEVNNVDNNDLTPDYSQMTVRIDDEDKPIIPGTSWAGAFRHHMNHLGIDEKELEVLYGKKAETKNNKQLGYKSLIAFSETVINNSTPKILSRNAIDRFTGGTKDSALFTEKQYRGGDTVLKLSVDLGRLEGKEYDKVIHALAAAIADLHLGLLAVGGETSIGHGLFKITNVKIDDEIKLKDISGDANEASKIYDVLQDSIKQI